MEIAVVGTVVDWMEDFVAMAVPVVVVVIAVDYGMNVVAAAVADA